MPVFNNILAGAAGSGGAAGYEITRSLRFNSADSAYLDRTPSSAGSNTTWTLSTWVKKTGNDNHIFGAGAGNTPGRFGFGFNGSDKFFAFVIASGSTVFSITTDAVFRDPAAWYHIVLIADTANSTQADRFKIYVNGVLQSVSGTLMPSSQNTFVNTTAAHTFGRRSYTAADYFNGYLASTILVDGTAKDVTDFGAFDSNGVWQAAAYSGTYGTNGFHLDFSDNSSNVALGFDANVEDTRYSAFVTGFQSSFPPANMFDGSTSTFTLGSNGGGIMTFTPATAIPYTAASGGVELYLHPGSQPDRFRINGGSWVNQTNQATGGWQTISTGDGSITKMEFQDQATSEAVIYAIRVNGTILTDPSGANDWTVNNLSVASGAGNDSLIDTPTNYEAASGNNGGNYCTLNPLAKTTGQDPTLTNGNLDFGAAINGNFTNSVGTIAVSSGKWYVEYTIGTNVGSSNGLGFINSESLASAGGSYGIGQASDGWLRTTSVVYNNSSSAVSSLTSISSGDVVMLALDIDNGKAWWGLNGTFENSGNPSAGSNAMVTFTPGGKSFVIGISAYHASVVASGVINFGARNFAYSAPTGFKSICTTNLDDPLIPDGSAYFQAKTFTGNGGTQSVSDLKFSPDFLWFKNRTDSSAAAHRLFDTVRGASKTLFSNLTNDELEVANSLTSFDSNGFTVGSGNWVNGSGDGIIAWAWDAGTGSPVSNTDGSITSQVRANPTAGFSIATYTGTGSAATVGHGLNAAPEMIILKGRNFADDWRVYHKYLDATEPEDYYLQLHSANAKSADQNASFMNDTAPTSSVFSLGTDSAINGSTRTMVAYCFAPVEGYSAFGSYVGGSSPFVYTGFKPRFVLAKNVSGSFNWFIADSERGTSNPFDELLYPNESIAETTSGSSDNIIFNSNGFTIEGSGNTVNQSGSTFIYLAIAEHPFSANGGLAR